MRSSGPLGSHMAARPHLASPLPPVHSGQAALGKRKLGTESKAKDNGHLVALSPPAQPSAPQGKAHAAGSGRADTQGASVPSGVACSVQLPPQIDLLQGASMKLQCLMRRQHEVSSEHQLQLTARR